jgi:hypothetical protein
MGIRLTTNVGLIAIIKNILQPSLTALFAMLLLGGVRLIGGGGRDTPSIIRGCTHLWTPRQMQPRFETVVNH